MDGVKYREIIEGNLFQSSRNLRLGQRFTFQQDNEPKHAANVTDVKWLAVVRANSGTMGNDASRLTVVCVQRVPGSSPGRGERDGSNTVTLMLLTRITGCCGKG